MQRADGLAALSTSLAALSVRPHSTASTTVAATAVDNQLFKPPAHHLASPALTALPSASPETAPAPVVLPAFAPLPASTSFRDTLRHFLVVQEWRALTYSAWQSALRHYLAYKEECDLHAFTAHCQHATTAFQQLSLQVKLCIAHLQSVHGGDEWAVQLQDVQRLEREKLGLTVAMQELSSEWVIRRKEPFSSELQEQLLVRRQRMDEVVESINDILTEVKYEVRYKRQQ